MRLHRVLGAIAAAVLILVVASLFLIGGGRPAVSRVAANTVGSVVLDSGEHVPSLRAIEDLRLDGAAEEFVSIRGLRIAGNGTLVVPQFEDWHVRFYSPTGKLIARFGRQGRGPGELATREPSMGWRGDTIWIWDQSLRRITYVNTDGQYAGDESFQLAFAAPRDLVRFPALIRPSMVQGIHGGEYLMFATAGFKFIPRPLEWGTDHRRIIAVGAHGLIHRVVATVPWAADADTINVPGSTGRPISTNLPLRAAPHYRIADDGSRIAYVTTRIEAGGGHIRLVVLAATGDTLTSREYSFVGTPLPPNVLDSAIAFRAASLRKNSPALATRLEREALRRALPYYAPISAIAFGRDTTVWIGLRSTTANRVWMIVDMNGKPVGTLTLPSNLTVAVADRAHVWGVQTDDNDVPSVVRYRIVGNNEGKREK